VNIVGGKKSRRDLAPASRLATKHNVVSNNISPAAQISARTFINKFMEKAYFPDTKANRHALFLSVPLIAGYALHTYFRRTDNKTGQEIMKKHFTATLENVESGRVHTLITNYVSGHSFWQTAASLMMIFSFAGSIAKSHGPKFLYAYFGIGHVALTAATLGLNYAQIKEVDALRKEVKGEKEPEKNQLYSMKGERMKYMYFVGREMRKNGAIEFDVDKRQREVFRMGDLEFLDLAEQRYRERRASSLGGPLAINLLFPFIHPRGLMPMPFTLPVPWFFTNFTFTGAHFSSNPQYAGLEDVISLLALLPVVFFGSLAKKGTIYQFPGMKFNPNVPHGPAGTAGSTAAANVAKQNKPQTNIPAEVAGDVKLTKEQIEIMKRRAQKANKK
jgi:hypothetical protein